MSKAISAIILFLFLNNLVFAFHPGDEIPTDKSIWVKIDKANFKLDEYDEIVKIFIEAEGRASSNTNHCGFAFVAVYKNGSTDYNGDFVKGPKRMEGNDTLIFEPCEKNWTKWKLYLLVHAEKEKIGLSKEDLKNISSFELWIRAYADEEEKFWNQSYVNLTKIVSGEMEELYEEEKVYGENNKIEWFFLVIILATISIIIIYKIKK